MTKTIIACLLIALSFVPTFAQGSRTQASIDLLITGGTVITMDGSRRIIENGAIAVRNGEIVRVGTAAELRGTRARQTINAAGKVVIPGLINTHTHVPMSLFAGSPTTSTLASG